MSVTRETHKKPKAAFSEGGAGPLDLNYRSKPQKPEAL
jgi:hypothetical protein